jgi:hypothetical protein
MADRAPSAAQAMYGHLPSGARDVVQQGRQGTVAEALYPRPPAPKPAPNRYRETTSLAARCDADPMFEAGLALMGLRRIRRR